MTQINLDSARETTRGSYTGYGGYAPMLAKSVYSGNNQMSYMITPSNFDQAGLN